MIGLFKPIRICYSKTKWTDGNLTRTKQIDGGYIRAG